MIIKEKSRQEKPLMRPMRPMRTIFSNTTPARICVYRNNRTHRTHRTHPLLICYVLYLAIPSPPTIFNLQSSIMIATLIEPYATVRGSISKRDKLYTRILNGRILLQHKPRKQSPLQAQLREQFGRDFGTARKKPPNPPAPLVPPRKT